MLDQFFSGKSKTTQVGYVNRNGQLCTGHRGKPGTDHVQLAYRMVCTKTDCGEVYGANGTDVFHTSALPARVARLGWISRAGTTIYMCKWGGQVLVSTG